MSAKTAINIYDFDHTIYRGDASRDFLVYCMLRRPRVWKYLPGQAWAVVQYVFSSWSRKRVKEHAFAILQSLDDVDVLLDNFWKTHQKNIVQWYKDQHQETDIIISASPEFLLGGLVNKLGVAQLIATKMDKQTGKIIGANCRGKEKLSRLMAYDSSIIVGDCYSDSLSDMPILKLASRPFIVKKHKPVPFDEYVPSKLSKTFKDVAFIRFLFVGGINAFLGVVFAYGLSFVITNPLLAFVVGYLISLIVSYPLNSVITFKSYSFSAKQFMSFCISYIPNFLVQLICVHLLIGYLGVYRLFAYMLAVVIAVPVTFFLLSKHTFTVKIPD